MSSFQDTDGALTWKIPQLTCNETNRGHDLTLKAPRPAWYRIIPWCSSALPYSPEGNSDPPARSLRVDGIISPYSRGVGLIPSVIENE